MGVLPTDTIYGLAAMASNKQAVTRLYNLKHREQKPGTIIAASADQLVALGLDQQAVRAVEHLWPDSLSIIIPASRDLAYLDQGLGDLAVRIPKDEDLRRLLQQTGPLITSSANHPGQPPANNVDEAQRYFGDQVDFYADGGDRSGRPPSTLVRFRGGKIELLRQGAVTIDEKGALL